MAGTFNLTRANALEFLQRDFKHILERLDEEVPEQDGQSVAQWHNRLLKATIRALERLDEGRGRKPPTANERAAMSIDDDVSESGADLSYFNKIFGPPR
jgi:hypothetical protein